MSYLTVAIKCYSGTVKRIKPENSCGDLTNTTLAYQKGEQSYKVLNNLEPECLAAGTGCCIEKRLINNEKCYWTETF